VQSDPGKSTAKVRLPTPSYTDNSLAHGGKLTFSATLDGKPVSVKQDVELSMSDDHHQVTYIVTDEAGNKRKCHFIYRVDGKKSHSTQNDCIARLSIIQRFPNHSLPPFLGPEVKICNDIMTCILFDGPLL
jgi:hypothetical protein